MGGYSCALLIECFSRAPLRNLTSFEAQLHEIAGVSFSHTLGFSSEGDSQKQRVESTLSRPECPF